MFAFCKPAYCSLSASLLLANICRNRDVFRIHSLQAVIANLEMDSDYYAKATMQLSLPLCSPLYQAYRLRRTYLEVVQQQLTDSETDYLACENNQEIQSPTLNI